MIVLHLSSQKGEETETTDRHCESFEVSPQSKVTDAAFATRVAHVR